MSPIYIYYCDRCHKHGEWLMKMDEDGRECPYCDEPMRRIPAIPARLRVGRGGKGGGIVEHPSATK